MKLMRGQGSLASASASGTSEKREYAWYLITVIFLQATMGPAPGTPSLGSPAVPGSCLAFVLCSNAAIPCVVRCVPQQWKFTKLQLGSASAHVRAARARAGAVSE